VRWSPLYRLHVTDEPSRKPWGRNHAATSTRADVRDAAGRVRVANDAVAGRGYHASADERVGGAARATPGGCKQRAQQRAGSSSRHTGSTVQGDAGNGPTACPHRRERTRAGNAGGQRGRATRSGKHRQRGRANTRVNVGTSPRCCRCPPDAKRLEWRAVRSLHINTTVLLSLIRIYQCSPPFIVDGARSQIYSDG